MSALSFIKITGGKYKGRKVAVAPIQELRPTSSRVREAMFNILFDKVKEASVLDLYSGSGVLGLEALSRGAKEVCFIERNRLALDVLQRNIDNVSCCKQTSVLAGDVFNKLNYLAKKDIFFDIILADPPYTISPREFLHNLKDNDRLKPDGLFVLEHRQMLTNIDDCSFRLLSTYIYGQSLLTLLEKLR